MQNMCFKKSKMVATLQICCKNKLSLPMWFSLIILCIRDSEGENSLRTDTLSNATLRSAIFIIVCACLCVFFSVYPLLLRTPGQQKADLCRETLSRDAVVRPAGIRRHCPLSWRSCFSWRLISKIHTHPPKLLLTTEHVSTLKCMKKRRT